MNTAYVCLGRNGDILNALPVLFHDYQCGHRATLVVARDYEGLLDGVSYCDRFVFDGHYDRVMAAMKQAEQCGRFDEVRRLQCYGHPVEKRCATFCEDAWRLAGKEPLFGRVPLIFDRRSREREEALRRRIPTDKPIVLLCLDGVSSPFQQKDAVLEALKPLRSTHEIVDVTALRAERFYDLLGLFDAAKCLVTIDSGPLHLANATPQLPVIAIVNNARNEWLASPRRPNHVLRLGYEETRWDKLVECINDQQKARMANVIHVWSDYDRKEAGAARRHALARQTWESEADSRWIECRLHDSGFQRSSKTAFRDSRACPFLKDIIERAVALAGANDIILLTNDDTCIRPGLTDVLLAQCARHGALWGARNEHRTLDRMLVAGEVQSGYKHVGADLFAFTRRWWEQHGPDMPDMLYGFEAFDLVLKKLILLGGGIELDGLCYHEIHRGEWLRQRKSPAAKHNQDLAFHWFRDHGLKWGVE